MEEGNIKKILIVENDRALQVALRDFLINKGYEVTATVSGEEGLETAKEQKSDLIILDLMLGQMTGIDVLREIRSYEGWGQNVSIIVLTGLTYLTELDEVKELSTKFIPKSDFDMNSLATDIKKLIG